MLITVWIVLGIVAAVVCLLLFAEIKIKILLSKEGEITVRYLFFKYSYNINKKKSAPKKSSKNKSKENYISKLIKEKGIVEGFSEIVNIIKKVFVSVFKLFSGAKVLNLDIKAKFSEGDASSTAMTYGLVSAVFYPLLGWLNSFSEVKKQNVDIKAVYTENTFLDFNFEALLSVRVFRVFGSLGGFIWELLVNTIKNNINLKG